MSLPSRTRRSAVRFAFDGSRFMIASEVSDMSADGDKPEATTSPSARLRVNMVADREQFEKQERALFLDHMHERVGDVPVELVYVDDIPRSSGGKHSVIKR